MDSAELALELLLTRDPARAADLAGQLEQKNSERQQLTERVLLAARAQAQGLADQPLLVLRGTGWPGGVLGLVAARIADEFGRPAVIVEVGPDACRGSGRSLAGFDLVEALTGCADLLLEYGGHSLAAGFAVLPDRLDALVERLVDAAAHMPPAYDLPVHVDVALAETDLDWALHRALAVLRPFGAGNPQPLFVSHRLRLLEVRTVGEEGRHLRLRLRCGRQVLTAFGPDLGHRAPALRSAGNADALYSLDVSSWNGGEVLELRLHDVRPAAPAPPVVIGAGSR
jgi:single-stranded-DNA-specific exonuclease